jgi:alanine-synthesizing transaminase
VIFSKRADWNPTTNLLTTARQKRSGDILDLTQSNPTQVGIPYPSNELAEIMARAAQAHYDPHPLGLPAAREALASELGCDANDLVLTASTSEAYAFLFKLLCDAGDDIVTAIPSYPLFERLAGLELVPLRSFPMQFHKRWEIEANAVREAITPRTRAIIVVNPNNPTGSFVGSAEQDALAGFDVPVISDEVFLDFPLQAKGTTFARNDVLNFTLGGLSKSAGLPHYKLAWIRVSGPPDRKRDALAGLELIADNYLSVGTPVQVALPDLLRVAPRVRQAISARTRTNLDALRSAMREARSANVLPVEGGWSAVARLPRIESDEEFAVRLIRDHGVFVHPGYFFDFPGDGFLVLSLLTPEKEFEEGVRRIMGIIPA